MPVAMLFLAACIFGNTLIAALLWLIGFGGTFTENLIFSQCIGLAIMAFCQLAIRLTPCRPVRWLAVLAAILAGGLIGQIVARLLTSHPLDWQQPLFYQSLVIGLMFGGVGSVYFFLRERNVQLSSELQRREQQRLEAEKRSIEAQLNMLQAQIEPHFLFNTLANVSALLHSSPPQAGQLLDALIHYLRASLTRTRSGHGTLEDEIRLLDSYLSILGLRMGARLAYSIDIPPELRTIAFPPMLLQPLVENAIVHGLEPKVEGGRVDISARLEAGTLRLSVCDNGLGFGEAPQGGFGLDNIRARLQSLFGEAARLELSENPQGGVTAALFIPWSALEGNP